MKRRSFLMLMHTCKLVRIPKYDHNFGSLNRCWSLQTRSGKHLLLIWQDDLIVADEWPDDSATCCGYSA